MLILFLFRGSIYRSIIVYHPLGTREVYPLQDSTILKKIPLNSSIGDIDRNMSIAQKFTNKYLSFSFGNAPFLPEDVFHQQEANCVGYAALYSATLVYLNENGSLTESYEVRHLYGQLYFMGFDLHRLFKSPFFKDHDYVEIIHKSTGEKRYVDPSLSDYLWIQHICTQ
ncbi:MAG: hypothetical protein MI974_21095 [Chitinophagales bacterium]|nr:hypothetical protein [Chitinophagales bacterium]